MTQLVAAAPKGAVSITVRGVPYHADWEVRDGALSVTAPIGSRKKSVAGLERMPDTLARLLLLELVRGDPH